MKAFQKRIRYHFIQEGLTSDRELCIMDKKVTMNTKGITKDDSGNYGIWRTVKKVGKIFIRVGETTNEAVARKTKEWLNTPISELKKQAQRPYQEKLDSKIRYKISSVRSTLERDGSVVVYLYSFEYRYRVKINKDYSYKILSRKRLL